MNCLKHSIRVKTNRTHFDHTVQEVANLSFAGLWRDTVCKKGVRHCVMCEVPDPQQVFMHPSL